jgi:porin
VSRGHVGAYLSFDQVVLRHGEGRRAQLGVFARAGWADPDVNRVEWLWSVGLESAGAIPGRARDVLGFGVYQTIASSTYRCFVDPRFDRETGIELYYAAQALGWLVVTPDLQYIVSPGATGAADDAFVASLRMRVTF